MRESLCAAGAAVRVRAAHSTLPRSSAGPIQTQAGFVATAQLPHDVWCAHAHIPRAYDGSSHSPNGSVPIDAISQVPLAWHQKHPSLESPGSRQLSQEAWSAQGILEVEMCKGDGRTVTPPPHTELVRGVPNSFFSFSYLPTSLLNARTPPARRPRARPHPGR